MSCGANLRGCLFPFFENLVVLEDVVVLSVLNSSPYAFLELRDTNSSGWTTNFRRAFVGSVVCSFASAFSLLGPVISTGCGLNRRVDLVDVSTGSGANLLVDFAVVSTGSGTNLLAPLPVVSICSGTTFLDDFVIVSTGSGANLLA